MKKIKQKIIYLISRAEIIYKISKKITDYHNNNCDIRTNGEGYFIEKHKETFDIVFDVGANIGEWSQYMYNAKPNSKIYSFEPSKQTFTRLKENIKNPNNKIISIFACLKILKKQLNICYKLLIFKSLTNGTTRS